MIILNPENPLVLIGCGNMGQALAEGWIASGALTSHSLVVLDRNPDKRAGFYAKTGCHYLSDYETLFEHYSPRVICLGIKPHQLAAVSEELLMHCDPGQFLTLSMLAGTTTDTLSKALGKQARVVRIMPNTPVSVRAGVTGCAANALVHDDEKQWVTTLMQQVGLCIWPEKESALHALTGVSGSGSAYVFYLMHCLQEAAVAHGFEAGTARLLANQTFLGAAQMAAQSQLSLEALRRNVTSPKGTTQAGLDVLMHKQLEQVIEQTVQAASQRSRELAGEKPKAI